MSDDIKNYAGEYSSPASDNSGNDAKSPYNDLELQFMLTQPAWGREYTEDLYEAVKISLSDAKVGDDGSLVVNEKPLWGILSYYTRDIRLGNLSSISGEFEYCQFWLDFAGICLRTNNIQSFLTSLTRVITLLELSQSKGGFLRRRQGTITTEKHETSQNNSSQRSLLGGHKPKF